MPSEIYRDQKIQTWILSAVQNEYQIHLYYEHRNAELTHKVQAQT